ncbi:MAG: 4a-hydroxytetrahydrobiopterin dehydratase [Anaerolineae bacterium]|nr:4a-hydroxytetrahydrobiopterin dehydratase [Thermoflexales bacterium]MDW8406535.1 4a-hydroxytetrahydrobiopterin dehydratase [Anaerolineae bacterium]
MTKLSPERVRARLAEAGGWTLNTAGAITKTFEWADFKQALLFVNAVGWLAEAANHHPDILIAYRRVTLTLSTHDAGGLTDKDFDLAAQIDALA